MNEKLILTHLFQMPEELKQEVFHYIQYLINNYKDKKNKVEYKEKYKPTFGSAKGKYILSNDFDEPLDY